MNILLPVDGSAVSLEAVRFAVRMARSGLDVSAVLANVQEPATLYELVVAHDPEVIAQVSAAAFNRWFGKGWLTLGFAFKAPAQG